MCLPPCTPPQQAPTCLSNPSFASDPLRAEAAPAGKRARVDPEERAPPVAEPAAAPGEAAPSVEVPAVAEAEEADGQAGPLVQEVERVEAVQVEPASEEDDGEACGFTRGSGCACTLGALAHDAPCQQTVARSLLAFESASRHPSPPPPPFP